MDEQVDEDGDDSVEKVEREMAEQLEVLNQSEEQEV